MGREDSIDTRKILVVDDEQNIRLVLKGMLGGQYIVLEASDGQEAIDIACSQKPDLIFMDLFMPGTDGYTACHRIKTDKATKGIPVVILTAVGHQLNRELGKQVGADEYLTKPFKKEDLLDVIGRLLK